MDSGQIVYILGRLVLGATASFLAIMLWSRIRDAAWILVIIGTIVAYVETVYSILTLLGIANEYVMLGSMSLLSILLPCLSTLFFIAAFTVMVARKYRRR
jgi:uncharacterized membrane protein